MYSIFGNIHANHTTQNMLNIGLFYCRFKVFFKNPTCVIPTCSL